MTLTRDKFAALAVYALIVGLALAFLSATAPLATVAILAVSLPGLALIWFAEPLGEIGAFARGISLPSPPALIETFGWMFLVGYPLLVFLVVRGQI